MSNKKTKEQLLWYFFLFLNIFTRSHRGVSLRKIFTSPFDWTGVDMWLVSANETRRGSGMCHSREVLRASTGLTIFYFFFCGAMSQIRAPPLLWVFEWSDPEPTSQGDTSHKKYTFMVTSRSHLWLLYKAPSPDWYSFRQGLALEDDESSDPWSVGGGHDKQTTRAERSMEGCRCPRCHVQNRWGGELKGPNDVASHLSHARMSW